VLILCNLYVTNFSNSRRTIIKLNAFLSIVMQNLELPLSNNPQPVSSMELESGAGEEKYLHGQDIPRISQETKDSVTSASELPSRTVRASKVVATTSCRTDSQLKSGQRVTQHERLISSLSGTGLSSHSESVHVRLSVSADQSRRSSRRSTATSRGQSPSSGGTSGVGADLKSTSRSLSTTHGRRSDSQGRSSYYSRRSSSSDRRHSGSVREHGDGGDRSLERPRRRPGGTSSDDRPRTSCNRESVLQRLGHRTDRASYREHDRDQRKYEVLEKPRTSREESLEGRGNKVEEMQSEDVVLCKWPESQLRDDLGRLSMTVTGTSTAMVQDHLETSTEYQPVLTRHVNQLFIRGDNVALVAILG